MRLEKNDNLIICPSEFPAFKVREAGEEAWLGREAPEDPELDGPEEPLLALPSSGGIGGALGALNKDSTEATAGTSTGPAANTVGFGASSADHMPYSQIEVRFQDRAEVTDCCSGHLLKIHAKADCVCSGEGVQLSVVACGSSGSQGR